MKLLTNSDAYAILRTSFYKHKKAANKKNINNLALINIRSLFWRKSGFVNERSRNLLIRSMHLFIIFTDELSSHELTDRCSAKSVCTGIVPTGLVNPCLINSETTKSVAETRRIEHTVAPDISGAVRSLQWCTVHLSHTPNNNLQRRLLALEHYVHH